LTLEARRLLAHSDLTAAQVGFQFGFEDPAYFARFFRREAGEAPTRFRAHPSQLAIRPPDRARRPS
jgi:AraC-like DNA-binding protein